MVSNLKVKNYSQIILLKLFLKDLFIPKFSQNKMRNILNSLNLSFKIYKKCSTKFQLVFCLINVN